MDGALGSIFPSASFSPVGNYVFSECDVVGVGVLEEKRKLEIGIAGVKEVAIEMGITTSNRLLTEQCLFFRLNRAICL